MLRDTAPGVPDGGDWQFRVLAAAERERARPRRRWLALATAAALAAAAVVALRAPGKEGGLRIAIDNQGLRSADASAGVAARGASVEVRAPAQADGYSGLWVYVDQRLELQCSDACREDDEQVHAFEAELGSYDILLVYENDAPPPLAGDLSDDYGAARARGAQVERHQLSVR